MKGKWVLGIGLAIVVAAAGLAYAGAAAAPGRDEPAPAQVVTDFYNWYLGYIRGAEEMRNPLADGAYRSSECLADSFIDEVDETVASFGKGGYDPFLMAQDIPQSVTVGEASIDGDEAQVRVETSFEGHALMVTLQRLDGKWQITSITLAPEMVVSSFYDWYLWYARGSGEMRNPLVDGAYRDCGALTDRFADEIERTLASFDKGGCDPILLAQDVPERVEVVEAAITGDGASVRAHMFWANNPTPGERIVTLVLVDGNWKIDAIAL
ncbi:MAG: DUF3828 domain-containing protein [Anaerolineae bacterium]|nr:DUF3828 domain-containing protein [Anaerolineae bacterium]